MPIMLTLQKKNSKTDLTKLKPLMYGWRSPSTCIKALDIDGFLYNIYPLDIDVDILLKNKKINSDIVIEVSYEEDEEDDYGDGMPIVALMGFNIFSKTNYPTPIVRFVEMESCPVIAAEGDEANVAQIAEILYNIMKYNGWSIATHDIIRSEGGCLVFDKLSNYPDVTTDIWSIPKDELVKSNVRLVENSPLDDIEGNRWVDMDSSTNETEDYLIVLRYTGEKPEKIIDFTRIMDNEGELRRKILESENHPFKEKLKILEGYKVKNIVE